MMKLRLSLLPIIIENNISTIDNVLDLEYEANIANYLSATTDLKEKEIKRAKHKSELLNNLNMHISLKNNTSKIIDITTDNAEYYIGLGNKLKNIFSRPILINRLKPGEEFDATCIASLNISLKNNIYLNCAACAYEEINDNEFDFLLESDRQISEQEIIYRACKIIIFKLERLQKYILSHIKNDAEEIAELKIENENHTMGNLITRALQDHKNIAFCGYMIDHIAVNELTIKYKTEGKNFTIIYKEITKNLIQIFQTIANKIINI